MHYESQGSNTGSFTLEEIQDRANLIYFMEGHVHRASFQLLTKSLRLCAYKLSLVYNIVEHEIFTDCRVFAFCKNKFSSIWISDLTAGHKFFAHPRQSMSRMVLVSKSAERGCDLLFITFYSCCEPWHVLKSKLWTLDDGRWMVDNGQ